MQTQSYLSARHIKQRYDVSTSTLRRWTSDGRLASIRTGSDRGRRLYSITDVARLFGEKEIASPKQRLTVLYARVSSSHQRADLERQLADLRAAYPDANHIFHDIGSGLNYHRAGLTALLDTIHQGIVQQVVVTHADRLVRFGLELVEWICRQHDTKIVVLCAPLGQSDTAELQDDLLAITTFFVARNNGRRAAANKRRRQAIQEASKGEKSVAKRRA